MSTNRKPVPSVPINRNKVKSRTDHGQSPEWKRERRASQQNHVQTNRRTVDFDYKDTSPRRMSALERAGIRPVILSNKKKSIPRSPARSSPRSPMFNKVPTTTNFRSNNSNSNSNSNSKDYQKILWHPNRLQVTTCTSGQMQRCNDLGNGWVQRTDPKQVGSFKNAGLHTIVECRGGQFFICTREPSSSHDNEDVEVLCSALQAGQYDFEISVKPCIIPNTNRTHQRVHILIGYKNPMNFICLTQDADQHMWRIDSFREENNGQATLLMNVEDKMIRPNRFSKVLVQCRGKVLAVSVGGRTLIQGLVMKDESALIGAVGVATMRSKMIFKEALISTVNRCRSSNNENINDRKTYNTIKTQLYDRRNGKKEERNVRSGSLMLPERMMHGAKDAGLGNADGGMFGHMRSLQGTAFDSPMKHVQSSGYGQEKGRNNDSSNGNYKSDERPLLAEGERQKPFVGDDRYLIDMIERDIIHRELGVSFEQIAGLETAKRLLNEVRCINLTIPLYKFIQLILNLFSGFPFHIIGCFLTFTRTRIFYWNS
jgi:hypothetical protein